MTQLPAEYALLYFMVDYLEEKGVTYNVSNEDEIVSTLFRQFD